MATKVLITDGMASEGVDLLSSHGEFEVDHRKGVDPAELAEIIGQYDCIVIRSATTLTRELLDQATQGKMKLVLRAGAGVDNIDVAFATEKNLPVMNTASANSLAAAEQTIGLLFAMFRQIPQAATSLREGRWDRALFKGYEVTGKVLGLIGLGNIGRLVAEKAVGIGMNVVAYDPFIQNVAQFEGRLSQMGESISVVSSMDELLPHADVLSVHIPKTADTTHLINAETLSKMKDGTFVMNCARGGIVDEQAVLSALESGKLKGAAFDVFEKEPAEFPHPLFDHPQVVCTPHLGASTFEAQGRVAVTAAEQIIGFFVRQEKTGVINL